MTFKLLKSQVPPNFDELVKLFIQAKEAHRFTENVAAPSAHPFIEAAVRRVPGVEGRPDDFVADYEITDDNSLLSLRERKDALMHEANVQVHEVLTKILPPGKRRLHEMKSATVRVKQNDNAIAEQAGLPTPHTFTDDEKTHIEFDNRIQEHFKIAQFHLAQVHSDIEDLTEANINAWVLPPLPNAQS